MNRLPCLSERRRGICTSILLVLLLLLPPQARAQQSDPPTVTLVTFGRGAELFEQFGHNALWFHDPATGQDVAYHWGLFSFNEPHFVARFLTGDNRYWMGPQDARSLIEHERQGGRPVTLQRLNLTPDQARALFSFVHWNEKPENAFYRYDYFQDNCSTRLRDALDRAVGGAIRRATDTVMTDLTFRRESVRLTQGSLLVQVGIDLALGRPADAPLTAWQSFFIPMRLRDALRTITVAGANGAQVPIVAAERVLPLPPSVHPLEEQAAPSGIAIRCLLLGVALTVFVGVLTFLLPNRTAAWALAFFGAAWSLVSGLIGVILILAWGFTKHVFWASNENTLLFTPLSLFLVVLIPAAVLSSKGMRAARTVAAVITLASLAAAVISVYPGGQENHAIIALMVPVHLALFFALRAAITRDALQEEPT